MKPESPSFGFLCLFVVFQSLLLSEFLEVEVGVEMEILKRFSLAEICSESVLDSIHFLDGLVLDEILHAPVGHLDHVLDHFVRVYPC